MSKLFLVPKDTDTQRDLELLQARRDLAAWGEELVRGEAQRKANLTANVNTEADPFGAIAHIEAAVKALRKASLALDDAVSLAEGKEDLA